MSERQVMSTVRIMTVDDHPMLREGLASIIACSPRLELVAEAANGREAVERYLELRPDVVIMDIQMPVMDGLTALSVIVETDPAAKVLMLTTYAGDVQAVNALKAGAAGYLLKSTLKDGLSTAIDMIVGGRRYLDPEIAGEIALHVGDEPLRERELRTLELVAKGKANKEIARETGQSLEIVKADLRSVFSKLDVRDRTQAVITALRRGIIGLS